jgi:uncharacterized protein
VSSEAAGVQGITEADIANFLVNDPGFFERQSELLASIQLRSPHGNRAISLQERQMEMLRQRIKGLELKIVEMIRHGQENLSIADRLQEWTRQLLLTRRAADLPQAVTQGLQQAFLIPQVAIRLWALPAECAAEVEGQPFAQAVSDDVRQLAQSLSTPFCGANHGFEAASWMPDGAAMQSMALIPLRVLPSGDPGAQAAAPGLDGRAFGMLVLASPDATRFAADMGTEFLARMGEVAGAALARLYDPAQPIVR